MLLQCPRCSLAKGGSLSLHPCARLARLFFLLLHDELARALSLTHTHAAPSVPQLLCVSPQQRASLAEAVQCVPSHMAASSGPRSVATGPTSKAGRAALVDVPLASKPIKVSPSVAVANAAQGSPRKMSPPPPLPTGCRSLSTSPYPARLSGGGADRAAGYGGTGSDGDESSVSTSHFGAQRCSSIHDSGCVDAVEGGDVVVGQRDDMATPTLESLTPPGAVAASAGIVPTAASAAARHVSPMPSRALVFTPSPEVAPSALAGRRGRARSSPPAAVMAAVVSAHQGRLLMERRERSHRDLSSPVTEARAVITDDEIAGSAASVGDHRDDDGVEVNDVERYKSHLIKVEMELEKRRMLLESRELALARREDAVARRERAADDRLEHAEALLSQVRSDGQLNERTESRGVDENSCARPEQLATVARPSAEVAREPAVPCADAVLVTRHPAPGVSPKTPAVAIVTCSPSAQSPQPDALGDAAAAALYAQAFAGRARRSPLAAANGKSNVGGALVPARELYNGGRADFRDPYRYTNLVSDGISGRRGSSPQPYSVRAAAGTPPAVPAEQFAGYRHLQDARFTNERLFTV